MASGRGLGPEALPQRAGRHELVRDLDAETLLEMGREFLARRLQQRLIPGQFALRLGLCDEVGEARLEGLRRLRCGGARQRGQGGAEERRVEARESHHDSSLDRALPRTSATLTERL